jgi:SAM-dependent methyltransferase
MTQHDWNTHYASNELPWDTGQPEPTLVEWLDQAGLQPGRALEIGCGTGTNALWLAQRGFDVLALDLAPLAIERARAKARAQNATRCELQVRDFMRGEPLPGTFQLVFDRGCFHVFQDPEDQARFAERVAALLAPGGVWLSLIGSTEGAERAEGPPRRNAREIVNALEPSLELVTLRTIEFTPLPGEATPPRAWFCLSRLRHSPALPSTRWVEGA